MAPPRPIPVRRGSIAHLASSLAQSLADPSPFAQEVLARDLAELTPEELAADRRATGTITTGSGSARLGSSVTSTTSVGRADKDDQADPEQAIAAEDEDDDLLDADWPHGEAPLLYRRPSAIAYGTSRPVLGVASVEAPSLSLIERKQSRAEERSLLRDNHLLPPKHAVSETGLDGVAALPPVTFFRRVYKRLFSTKVRRRQPDEEVPAAAAPTEHTALLGTPGPSSSGGGVTTGGTPTSTTETRPPLDQQWEEAVAAGQIHTTWQREAKTITVYSRSLIVTFLLQYSINITSIFAVGHIGKAELGAVSLATMTASITFISPVQGLATCLDTLCSQAYGSGHRTLVGLNLQRLCSFMALLVAPLAVVWLNAEPILVMLLPDQAHTAALAGQYLRILVFSMPATAVFECSKRYMQAQGLFSANTQVLLIAAPLNIFLNWLFVWHFEWGFVGAPLASTITQWVMLTLIVLYVVLIDGAECWGGFSRRAFSNWGPMVRLALPGMIMIEAEYFAFEIMTLAAGRFGATELAAQSILVTISSTAYQLPFPMSVAVSTRVANLIGAKLPDAARTCAKVAFVGGILIGLFNLTVVATLREPIANLFTNDVEVVALVARTAVVCACMQVFDGMSAVASGLLRGVGRQEVGGYANLIAYYVIALPIGFFVAFGMDWGLAGLWLGLCIGLFLVAIYEFHYLASYNWQNAVEEAERRNASG